MLPIKYVYMYNTNKIISGNQIWQADHRFIESMTNTSGRFATCVRYPKQQGENKLYKCLVYTKNNKYNTQNLSQNLNISVDYIYLGMLME